MKAKITIFSLAVVMSGCAIDPVSIAGPDGKQRYTLSCNSGTDKCHQKAAKLCPSGYDVIEHSKESSTRVAHYGEYPITTNIENFTIDCQ